MVLTPAFPLRGPARKLLGITVYACEPDEAALFTELASRFGVVPTLTSEPASVAGAASGPQNRCVSVGHKARVSGPTLRALREAGVEYVSSRSRGVDHIDQHAAAALGITVENVDYEPDGVADYTVMLMLMAIRNAKAIVSSAQADDFRLHPVRGRELRDLTVGIVGVGQVGAAVIARLQGFGCRVLASSPGPIPPGAAKRVAFDALLRDSDVISLHLPLDASTHHVIGRAQIAAMRSGAVLVNTGRGGLVDTGALVEALEDGRLGGAALDVVEGEEGIFYVDCTDRPMEHQLLGRLQDLPNAIISPHTAYYTDRVLRATVEATLRNCRRFERDRAHG
ncbi:MAG TPA: NAD(P)-dependent oxidoreductase [Candidatus Limnocylindrales bacterium]|nr:NAD(P)-dependent oxidoreductase [Candidatus Limnocylindrales bacterium]